MSKKSDQFVVLRELLQSLHLQEEDVERIVKEVTQLATVRPNSAGSNSNTNNISNATTTSNNATTNNTNSTSTTSINNTNNNPTESDDYPSSESGGSSPGRTGRSSHSKTGRRGPKFKSAEISFRTPPNKNKRELLVSSTLLQYNECEARMKPTKEFEDLYTSPRAHTPTRKEVPENKLVLSPRTEAKSKTLRHHRSKKRINIVNASDGEQMGSEVSCEDAEKEEEKLLQVEEKRKIEKDKLARIKASLEELCESEANYMKRLQIVITDFLFPLRQKVQEIALGSPGLGKNSLRSSRGMMKDADSFLLFANIENLVEISQDFLKELSIILEKWPKYGIKSPFVMLLNVVSAYKQYTSNWNNVPELLSNSKSPVTIFLQDRAYRCQHDLLNLLSLPLTRLPQYEGVLHDILSTLPSFHPDYAGLKDTYQFMKNFVQELDSIRHRSENGAVILKIMRRMVHFDGSLVEEGRFFVHEEQVTWVRNKKKHNGMMTLFSDILLFARYSHYSNNLRYKYQLRLANATLVPSEADDRDKNSFRIKVKVLSENTYSNEVEYSFLVYSATPEAKEKWITTFYKVLQNIAAKKVFGCSLSKNKEVPLFLKKLLVYLRSVDMNEEDLLKINYGNTAQIHKIKQDADCGKNVEFSSPALAASVLKLYLRELPEALLAEMRCWFLELATVGEFSPVELRKFYLAVIKHMPSLNKDILKKLMHFFSALTKRKDLPNNKITPRSIGVTFGSNLFYGKGDVEPADLQLVNAATEYLVSHYEELFENPLS